ncbi:MAG: EAL domain-containing protein [Jatrophihabitantaceae bacterium]
MSPTQRLQRAVARVRSPRRPEDVRIAFQPIISVSTGATLAVEALARFADRDETGAVFRAADEAGRGPDLEARCVEAALRRRGELPAGMMLSINVSPNALPHLAEDGSWPDDLRGVIVEITEQEIESPTELPALVEGLRNRGAAIAIDDVSTGYSGLMRIAQMRPDYVKIDRQVVSGLGEDVLQAAVLEALVTLSHRLGAAVIGEGVESLADLAALSGFDVDYAQGFAIGRPSQLRAPVSSDVVAACRANRRHLLRGAGASAREVARTRDVYAVTAALASAGHRHDIDAAIAAAAADLGMDMIGVSILTGTMCLREIASTAALDPDLYPIDDYPATRTVVTGGVAAEVQLADTHADLAERTLMQRLGHASLLLVPVCDIDRTIGIVEFAHSTPRRWSAQDIAHAQGLAEHLSPVLRRLGVGTVPITSPMSIPVLAQRTSVG